ncbi:MAG TPA: AMP-binding protein [Acidimicrobiales bacterium]|nr:AMP-binding protein [Acidimicrobiales bacterium]
MKPDLTGLDPLSVNLATRVSVGDALGRSAAMFPARPAIIDRGLEVSYERLDQSAEALATSLVELGCARQTPVTMLMGNSWRFLATFFACAKSGLVAMPVNVVLAPSDIEWIINDAGSHTLVVDEALVDLVERMLPSLPAIDTVLIAGDGPARALPVARVLDWDQLAGARRNGPLEVLVEDRDTLQCLYTSGTTSRPKGVLVSHLSVLIAAMTDALMMEHRWGAQPSVLINVLPLFHTTALNTLCLPVLVTGGTVVLPGAFDPAIVLDAIQEHRATHLMMLPMMWGAVVDELAARARDVSSLTRAVYAMAPMGRDLLDRVDEAFANAVVILGSGQTEVVPATVIQWPEHRFSAPASWGPSVPTVTTRCMDLEGRVLGPDEVGEIVYRGPHVSSGYWNNPEANRIAFAHGWFHSGDIGHLDEHQVVWFSDRLKDIIKSGGENVSSVDVERVVNAAPGVRESAIVGVADPRWGEAVCAVVVPDGSLADAALADAVIAYAKEHLAGFQVPKRVVIVAELAKTATGKARKNELRAQLRDAAAAQG